MACAALGSARVRGLPRDLRPRPPRCLPPAFFPAVLSVPRPICPQRRRHRRLSMASAETLDPPLRVATYRSLVGLMTVTGLPRRGGDTTRSASTSTLAKGSLLVRDSKWEQLCRGRCYAESCHGARGLQQLCSGLLGIIASEGFEERHEAIRGPVAPWTRADRGGSRQSAFLDAHVRMGCSARRCADWHGPATAP